MSDIYFYFFILILFIQPDESPLILSREKNILAKIYEDKLNKEWVYFWLYGSRRMLYLYVGGRYTSNAIFSSLQAMKTIFSGYQEGQWTLDYYIFISTDTILIIHSYNFFFPFFFLASTRIFSIFLLIFLSSILLFCIYTHLSLIFRIFFIDLIGEIRADWLSISL